MRIRHLLLWVAVAVCACDAEPYDVVLVGGTVIDGTGSDRFRADVGIRGDRIEAVSPSDVERAGAGRVIDVTGKIVVPGFIDIHSHLDPLLRLPAAESKARQGVTIRILDGTEPFRASSASTCARGVCSRSRTQCAR